ncbi:MAG TPA: hypothetical protein ENN72_08250 [Firmicutes bacterium]|nr:hypothetical protein [Bacillota bacterium]
MFEKYAYKKSAVRKMAYLSRALLFAMALAVGAYFYFRSPGKAESSADYFLVGAFIIFFPVLKYSRLFLKISTTRYILDDRGIQKSAPGRPKEIIRFTEITSVTRYKNGLFLQGHKTEMLIPSALERYEELARNIEFMWKEKREESV